MSREDIARLLGGYATGTLTPEEQRALFAAALEDQALFDELAREQALRDVLREPTARGQLLAALEDRPRWYRRFGHWMMRPATLTAAAACLLVLGSVAVWRPWRGGEAPKPAVVATALPREAPPIPSPPATVERKALAPLEEEAVAKAKTPAASPAMPAAKNQLLAAQGAAPVAEVRGAVEPSAAGGAAMPPAASPPPPKTVNPAVMTDLAITSRDTAEVIQVAPETGRTSAAAGNAAPRGALSVGPMQPAVAATPGGDARRRYYAGTALAAEKVETQNQAFRAAVQAPGSQPAPLGIKWSILRREANGEFVIVNAEDLRAGDTVELRLVPNQSCDLSIFDNANGKLATLFAKHVEAGETYDTPPLTPREKGLRELMVGLTRSGAPTVAGAPPAPAREGQQSETARGEQATYTVGKAGAQQVFLSIKLNYQ